MRAFKLKKNGLAKNNEETRLALEASIKLVEHRERNRELREPPPDDSKIIRPSGSFANEASSPEK